jgi:hypothetical protein
VRVVALTVEFPVARSGWWINPMKLSRLDEPLVVLVAGGGNLACLDGAKNGGLVRAGRIGGLLQTVSHAVRSVALIPSSNDASRWLTCG